MDLVFFSRAVANYLPHLLDAGKLGRFLIRMVENVLGADPDLLADSEASDGAMTRLQRVVSNVTVALPGFQVGKAQSKVFSDH